MPCMVIFSSLSNNNVLGEVEKTLQFYLTFALFVCQSWFWENRMMFEVFPGAPVPCRVAGPSLGSAVTQAWVPGLLGFFICNIGYCHLQYIMTSSKLNDEIKHLTHRRHSSKSRIFLSFLRPEVAPPFFLLSFPASLLIQNGFFSFCKQVKDLIG